MSSGRGSSIRSGAIRGLLAACVALAGGTITAACGSDSSGPDNGAPVASVTVAPASAPLMVGQTVQLMATLRDAAGSVLTGRTVTWSTSVGSVATVSSSGLVGAAAVGSATITATSEGQSGAATVTVSAASGFPQGLVPSGTIWYDLRTSLQNAQTTAQAAALIAGGLSGAETLAPNFDGTNRHALRLNITGGCGDGGAGPLELVGSGAVQSTDFYLQWRQRFGRHALDPSGIGAVDAVSWNATALGCPPPFIEKMVMIGVNPGTDRIDIDWASGATHWEIVGNGALMYNLAPSFENADGQEHVITYHFKTQPYVTVTVYVDGQQVGTASRTNASYTTINYIRLHNVWSDRPFDQTHYLWDIVAWTP